MRRLFALATLIFVFSGCARVPFKEPVLVPMGDEEPWALRQRFGEKKPEQFSLLSTIYFSYNGLKEISAIGSITVNTSEREFTVVCLNPLGVKLFELSASGDVIEERYAIKQFDRRGSLRAIGEDIRRVYFDLLPSPDAKARKRKYKVVFSEPDGRGRLQHIFAGAEGNLTEKKFYEDGSLFWKVSYYEYTDIGGKLFPGGVVLDNYKYGYRLVVKLKEVYGNEQD